MWSVMEKNLNSDDNHIKNRPLITPKNINPHILKKYIQIQHVYIQNRLHVDFIVTKD